MKFPIRYDKDTMTLTLQWGDHRKYLQCPFATWWKARKYFKRPKFTFYFGPMWKYKGKTKTEFGEYDDYEYKGGYWPAASTEFLKWYTPKWFPIHVLSWDIGWKDKWNSPRYEHPGHFIIFFGRDYHKHWQFSITITAPKVFIYDCTNTDTEDFYWESILTYLHYKKKNLFATRKSLQSHWVRHESTKIKRFSIVNTMSKTVFNKEYYVITLRCKYLLNKLSFSHSLTSDAKLTIRAWKDKTYGIAFSSFVQLENDLIHVYIYKTPQGIDFIEAVESNRDRVEVEVNKDIDLGPTFKDQFLNKRGIKLIQSRK